MDCFAEPVIRRRIRADRVARNDGRGIASERGYHVFSAAFFGANVDLMLSNSSTFTPFLRMM